MDDLDDVEEIGGEAEPSKQGRELVLPPDVMEEFQKGFSLYDPENTGNIEGEKLGPLLRTLWFNPTNSELENWIGKDSQISWDRFLEIAKDKLGHIDYTEDIKEAFATLDVDQSWELDVKFLHTQLTTKGEPLTERETQLFFKYADCKRRRNEYFGKLSYDEFVEKMTPPFEYKF